MAKRTTRTPAQRRDATDAPPPVDAYKRFHLAVAIAPVFAAEFFRMRLERARGDRTWDTYGDVADAVMLLADTIARRLQRAE
jgi:hypothetical protein